LQGFDELIIGRDQFTALALGKGEIETIVHTDPGGR
jgi:hypothetical protein